MKVLIIIPAYNEADNILHTIQELEKKNVEADYIIINDCSQDDTLSLLKTAQAPYIDLPINLGIGGGVQTGYKYAYRNMYDIAIQMDGDGQHLPEYILSLIQPIMEGHADLVIGSRFLNKTGFQSSKMRRIGITFLSNLIKVCSGVKVKDVTSGFRAANRKAMKLFVKEYAQDYPEPEAIITSALSGIQIVEVPVEMKERLGGVSSISSFRSMYYMIKVSCAIILQRIIIRRGANR